MVATLEEKYQLGSVKLSKFTHRQSPAHSKTVPDYQIVKKKPKKPLILPISVQEVWGAIS